MDLVQLVYKQVDGPPPATLEHTGADGGPIALKWMDIDTEDITPTST